MQLVNSICIYKDASLTSEAKLVDRSLASWMLITNQASAYVVIAY